MIYRMPANETCSIVASSCSRIYCLRVQIGTDSKFDYGAKVISIVLVSISIHSNSIKQLIIVPSYTLNIYMKFRFVKYYTLIKL